MGDSQKKIQLVLEAVNRFKGTFDDLAKDLKSAQGGANKTSVSFGELSSAIKAAAAAIGLWKIASFAKDAAYLAARVETLGIVMGVVGKNVGYSAAEMEEYATGVAKMGITTEESRQTVIRMVQAHLDLRQSAQLARVAQDAAVIANINSSEALGGILHGITTLQPEILRTYGIVVNFETEYKKFAQSAGRTVESLGQQEKQQIALNSVMERGKDIAGSYEAAMGTVGKQLTSLKRASDEATLAIGETFKPLLGEVVKDITSSLKDIEKWFKDNPATVKEWSDSLVQSYRNIKDLVTDLVTKSKELDANLRKGAEWLVNKFEQTPPGQWVKKQGIFVEAEPPIPLLPSHGLKPAAPAPDKKPPKQLGNQTDEELYIRETGEALGPDRSDLDAWQDKQAAAWKAQREAAINYELSLVAIAEQERKISASEATEKRIALLQEMVVIQEEYGDSIDRTTDTTGWYTQQNAIVKTREELLKLLELLREQNGGFTHGIKDSLTQYIIDANNTFKAGVALARTTAQGMEQAFSDFFFDAMTGKLKHLSDYISGFLQSIAREIANIYARKMAASIIAGALFHDGGLVMHQGGYVPRFHFGGLMSDERPAILQTGEGVLSRKGMSALDALNNGMTGGGVNVVVNVQNQTGRPVDAKTGGAQFNGKEYVVSVVLSDLEHGGPIRQGVMALR